MLPVFNLSFCIERNPILWDVHRPQKLLAITLTYIFIMVRPHVQYAVVRVFVWTACCHLRGNRTVQAVRLSNRQCRLDVAALTRQQRRAFERQTFIPCHAFCGKRFHNDARIPWNRRKRWRPSKKFASRGYVRIKCLRPFSAQPRDKTVSVLFWFFCSTSPPPEYGRTKGNFRSDISVSRTGFNWTTYWTWRRQRNRGRGLKQKRSPYNNFITLMLEVVYEN